MRVRAFSGPALHFPSLSYICVLTQAEPILHVESHWNWSPRPVEAPIFDDGTFSSDCKYVYVFLFVIFLLHAKKFPILVTSDKLQLLWITLWCTSNVATARPGQERHARDAWHEIRRLPPTRVEGDYSIFEHHHVRTNRETGEHYTLSYKLRRHRSLKKQLGGAWTVKSTQKSR